MSGNQEDIIELWLNDEINSDSGGIDEVSSALHNDTGGHSENEFSDNEEDIVLKSDHDSGSEISDNDELDENMMESTEETQLAAGYYYGKNRFKWAKTAPARNIRVRSHNILRFPCTASRSSRIEPLSPEEAFNMMFDKDIRAKILTWTNKKIAAFRLKYKSADRTELRECSTFWCC